MKTLLCAIAFALLAGCTSKTEFGPCVGVADDKDPTLVYKVSAWNLGVGLLFFELVVPPVVVAVDEFYCPVGKREWVK